MEVELIILEPDVLHLPCSQRKMSLLVSKLHLLS